MANVIEAPGQGDEQVVVSRRDDETQEHDVMATANILLNDNGAALQRWGILFQLRHFSASRSFRRRHTGFLLPLPRHSALCPGPIAPEIESKADGGLALSCKR